MTDSGNVAGSIRWERLVIHDSGVVHVRTERPGLSEAVHDPGITMCVDTESGFSLSRCHWVSSLACFIVVDEFNSVLGRIWSYKVDNSVVESGTCISRAKDDLGNFIYLPKDWAAVAV